MIKKPRTKPLKLLKLEVILQRLVLNHPNIGELQIELAKYTAGHRGEASLAYHLNDLDEDSYVILHDLRLPRDKDKQYYFQIDCVIIHFSFCVLLEVKNLKGDLYFDHQFDQMRRTINGEDETFPDPVNQVEQQKDHFKKWLTRNQFPLIPLHTLVVITNPKSFITISPRYGNKAAQIIRAKHLARIINNLPKLQNQLLTKKDISKITTRMLKQHQQLNTDLLKTYHIKDSDIMTGVACPFCKHLPMVRKKATWYCSACFKKSKNAHIQAIRDYAILFNVNVKNKTLRNFLHVHSSTSMKNLLKSMDINPSGPTNSATYQLPFPK
ncbi:nuclease-related domain-containing protein [Fictibacillus sp. b24]|uniref:nuclease-related domain-containing protein n=1 Tax=Fictibacillus sp. b24 TaxID=3055863 RepID=UPI0025A294CE|nr:nuclease-related domain-containing protein [Fictibacillus sp. b24]MDM5316293.1 nuclease-related domain-containing protein [Fictibacillus sp. b24]